MNQEKFKKEQPSQYSAQEDKNKSQFLSKKAEKDCQQEEMDFFNQIEPLGDIFVGSWGYHLELNPDVDSFYFDHKRKAIGINTQMIEKLNLMPDEKKFAFLHELSHLAQFFKNPSSYLESFEIPKQKSIEAAETFPGAEKEKIQTFSEESWRRFFNVFFDVQGNSIVERRTAKFQKGEIGERVISELYHRKLFAGDDYSQQPYSEQMVDYLLRQVMAPQAETKIAPEVRQSLEQRVNFFGNEFNSFLDFTKQEIYNPLLSTEELMFRLKKVLMPVFEKLLKRDIETGNMKIREKAIELSGGIDEDVAKDFAKGFAEEQKPSSEKMKDNAGQKFQDRAIEQGFGKKEIQRMMEIKKATAEIHQDLRDLWGKFIQRSVEIQQDKKIGFKRGAGIAPERLASEIGVLLTDPNQAEIFYRYIPQVEKENIKPKKICLYLVLDLSGSMNKEKRQAVQEVSYAVDKSLIDFYRDFKNSLADQGAETPFRIDLEMLGFGGEGSLKDLLPKNSQEIQERRKIDDLPQKDIEKDLWRGILKISSIDLGGTCDSQALGDIEKKITAPEVEKDLQQGNEIAVILEITDGETETVEQSKKLARSLNSKAGVYARAIQIPGPIYSEEAPQKTKEGIFTRADILPPTGVFKIVWGDYGRRLENLSALKDTIFDVLQDALRDYF